MMQIPEIRDLQNRAINYLLAVFTFMGIMAFFLIFFTSYRAGYAKLADTFVQLGVFICLIMITLFKERISKQLKIFFLVVLVGIICFSNIFTFGVISNAKILLVIFPAFLAFVTSWSIAVLVLFVYMLCYGIFAWLFQSGILHYNLDFNRYYAGIGSWLVTATIMIIGSVSLFVMGYHYTKAMHKSYLLLNEKNRELKQHRQHLQEMVQEKTEKLDKTIAELIQLNRDLNDKNSLILSQNQDLENTLQHLQSTHIQLIQAEKMASLGILTAGVAHEINNPLNFIASGYSILQEYIAESCDNEKNKEMMQQALFAIQEGIRRANKIVNSLTQYSRDSDNFNEVCDIHAILDNALLMLNSTRKENIQLEKFYAPNIALLYGNSGKLHQVFANLILNAYQAIQGNGKLEIITVAKEKSVLVEIKDNGSGIKKEFLSRITDPFFTTKEPGVGTGLGLSISYTIVKEHHGKLFFESEWGKGTSAFVELPAGT
jgi:signal transduction histidine kinase